jgi:DNA-binding NarL/FixJ family response regulator
MQEHGMPARGSKTAHALSDRERGVVALLADGFGTQEISEKLGLSPKTVETHRRKILLKLGLSNIAELTKYALREGLTLL